MQQVKNIIFDLGGIFLSIDFSKTEKAFREIGVTQFNDLYTQHYASDIFELLETGKISPEEFHHAFVHETGIPITYDQLKYAWTALLLGFPKERLQWLKEI